MNPREMPKAREAVKRSFRHGAYQDGGESKGNLRLSPAQQEERTSEPQQRDADVKSPDLAISREGFSAPAHQRPQQH